MSAALDSYTYEMDASYAADFSRNREPMKKRSRHPEYRRKGSAPACVSGMHCRRNKRWTWGTGRGARMANLRAFASFLALMIATAASSAHGQVSFNMPLIGNPGNVANPSDPSSRGAVAYPYFMADKEVTNAQYVEFLNKVDAAGSNTFGLYNSSMSTQTTGGISFDAAAAAGSKYSVRTSPAAPSGGPAGSAWATMPVNFVSWFSAARFVNWLNAGQPANSTAMNSGVYNLGTVTSGSIVPRGAVSSFTNTYVLPSQDEWYKAAFYTGSGSVYNLYATNTSTAPTATLTTTTANAANATNVSTNLSNVGAYTNASQSAFGMYDMFGNVGEMTDTPTGVGNTSYVWAGGGFGATVDGWNATAPILTRLGTAQNAANGFRVAAVPEPGTITLAAFGIAGIAGASIFKRRKKSLSRHRSAESAVA